MKQPRVKLHFTHPTPPDGMRTIDLTRFKHLNRKAIAYELEHKKLPPEHILIKIAFVFENNSQLKQQAASNK